MKVIINVSKGSSFSRYNGQTFVVNPTEFFTIKGKIVVPVKGLNANFPENITDFTQDELIFI